MSWWRTTETSLGVSIENYLRRRKDILMGCSCYFLLRSCHGIPIRCRGHVQLRRLGDITPRRRCVFHLRRNCDVAGDTERLVMTSLRRLVAGWKYSLIHLEQPWSYCINPNFFFDVICINVSLHVRTIADKSHRFLKFYYTELTISVLYPGVSLEKLFFVKQKLRSSWGSGIHGEKLNAESLWNRLQYLMNW